MKKGQHFLIGVIGLVFLLGVGLDAFAGQFGQFLAGRSSNGTAKIVNPTGHEIFALLINYDDSENFDNCEGFVLSERDTDSTSSPLDRSYSEVIAVPTGRLIAGVINTARFGVMARIHKHGVMEALNPVIFSGFQDDDVVDCACGELDNFSLPANLLRNFRIRCP